MKQYTAICPFADGGFFILEYFINNLSHSLRLWRKYGMMNGKKGGFGWWNFFQISWI